MATTNPTPNYGWVLPIPGGSIGAWGTLLNKIFGEDGTPLGIDGVLKAIQDDVDTAETDIAAIDTRVAALEAAGANAYYARIYRSSNQAIPGKTATQVTFNAESFDQNSLASGDDLVVPSGAAGLYEVRAQVLVPFHTSGDDSVLWKLEIRKGSTVLAEARTPHLNDGVSASSGNISLSVSCLDVAAEADAYTAHVYWEHPAGTSGGSLSVQGGADDSFLEAVRLVAA